MKRVNWDTVLGVVMFLLVVTWWAWMRPLCHLIVWLAGGR